MLLGAGALAKEVSSLYPGWEWVFLDPYSKDEAWNGMPIFKSFGEAESIVQERSRFFVPTIAAPHKKEAASMEAIARGWRFCGPMVHEKAYVHPTAKISNGVVIYPNASVSHNSKLGVGVVVSFNCSVGHDDVIGDYSTLSPSVSLSGNVRVGKAVFFGTNCCVREQLEIGDYGSVSMGSIIVDSVPSHKKAFTIPRTMILQGDNE
jgi:sugar O-acyltransferase (sialic acid O-acetyltransferase NeuD family)